jgi:hypothetical protein
MSTTAVAKIPKPLLRGHLAKQIVKNGVIASVLSVFAGVAFYFGVNVRRKQTYADFYKNYDLDFHYEEMKKAGVFQSTEAK